MNDNHSENLRFLAGGSHRFRSTREMWVYLIGLLALIFVSLTFATLGKELGMSVVGAFTCFFGIWAVGAAAWYSWQRWGRDAFPLPPPRGSDPEGVYLDP